jgi:amidase
MPVDPRVRDAVREAGLTLQALGHQVDEIAPPVDEDFGRDFLRYWALISFFLQKAGGRLLGTEFNSSRTELLTQELSRMARQQAVRIPGSLRRLVRVSREPEPIYASYDALLSPVLSTPPPFIGELGPQVPPHEHIVRLLRCLSACRLEHPSERNADCSPSPTNSRPLCRGRVRQRNSPPTEGAAGNSAAECA